MRNGTLFTLIFLLSIPLFAEPVEIAYDDGTRAGYFNQGRAGDIEAVFFTPEHPCSLLSFRFFPTGTGMMEWHLWADNGGNMPDVETDLIDPIRVNVQRDDDWVTVNVSQAGVTFNPPRSFHLGYVKQGNLPALFVDGGNPVQNRSVLRLGGTWYVTGNGSGNFLLRATVSYFDIREEFYFTDATQEAGLGAFSRAAWGDYNNDGWEDLLTDGRNLWRNNWDGTFSEVSDEAGLRADNPGGIGAWGDFDNDGHLDIFCGNSSLNADDRLYRNNGDGTFRMVNDAYWLYNGRDPTEAAGWGDADGDGFLELYIANSELWNDGNPRFFRDWLYTFNPREGVFLDISDRAGIDRYYYYGRGVAWCDFDNDGDLDLYISNYRLHPNFLLVNQGNLNFREEAARRGVQGVNVQGYYGHTIGSAWADYDNDGDFDLFVGNLAHPRFLWFSDKCMLYENSGPPNWTFTDRREEAGIAYDETASSPAWGDYDNDGFLDLFVTSVYQGRQPYLYRNNADGTFSNVNYTAGFHRKADNSWGAAWCDYDHDGDLDLAVGGGHYGLFKNLHQETHQPGDWIQVSLAGTESNRFAYGARVEIFYNCPQYGDVHQTRQVESQAGTGACQNMQALHFGLSWCREDEHRVLDSLKITWLTGRVERYYELAVNRRYRAVEGENLLYAGDGERGQVQPERFFLSDPFPNPFNSTASAEFQAPRTVHVQAALYHPDGRLMARVYSGAANAGKNRIEFHANHSPAGLYLLVVTADGKRWVKKVVVLN